VSVASKLAETAPPSWITARPNVPGLRLPPWAILGLGALAASGVGYAAAQSPSAAPRGVAVLLRVAIIMSLITAGLYARSSRLQAAMGKLLIFAGFFSVLWLLNGAGARLPFSLGVLAAAFAPAVFAYLILAHPEGRVRSELERHVVLGAGALLVLVWWISYLTARQPVFRTPLLACAPHCPANSLFVGGTLGPGDPLLRVLIVISTTVLACAPPLLILRRMRSARVLFRSPLVAVELTAIAIALLWIAFLIAHPDRSLADTLGAAYVASVVAIPIAILIGLATERLLLGQALVDLTTELAGAPGADPETVMGDALNDPSVRIAYQRPGRSVVVDSTGAELTMPGDSSRAATWIERDGRRVATVIYDARLANDERFVQAAGSAAIMHLEKAQLEADLKASTRELAASRLRLVEAADAERQRIERDLHDGIQQQLVGLRIRLDMAAEALDTDPERGQQMVRLVGRQMDDLIDTLRSLARAIYPTLLKDHGLAAALRSISSRLPIPITLRLGRLSRYSEDLEIAVYFCCLEAIQNVAKHAGPDAEVVVEVGEKGDQLSFAIIDSGKGFDVGAVKAAHGLVHMRDRVEALEGSFSVRSRVGEVTTVRGLIPIT
jgi:signal transduction histidine kinase